MGIEPTTTTLATWYSTTELHPRENGRKPLIIEVAPGLSSQKEYANSRLILKNRETVDFSGKSAKTSSELTS